MRLAALLLLLTACYPDPTGQDCMADGLYWPDAPSLDTCATLEPVVLATEDGVLRPLGLQMPQGFTVETRPASWMPQHGSHWDFIVGETECPTDVSPGRIILPADQPLTAGALCHELVHAARGCAPFDHEFSGKDCVSGFFCEHQVDQLCAEQMRGVKVQTLSGATGGTP